ncbi:choice-of-anchor Q domain-containing protein [Pedobacter sp.]|uniref:choice-of-anchor Q domain-containing protein n=1 Tax=Pedobacter sp. TaxID=1411316 RepID=UPI00396CC81A
MKINFYFKLLFFLTSFLSIGTAFAQSSLNFDGVNDYVRIPNVVSTASAFTIEFWMKTTQTGVSGTQWYNGIGLVDAEMGGVANDFGISLVGAKIAFGIGNTDKTIFSSSNVNTGSWVHVAAVWNANAATMKLYINGVLEASAISDVPQAQRNAPPAITLGAINTLNNYYNGSIDELRIWNVALAQPQDNINCPLSIATGLVAYYSFNDGTANGNNTIVTKIADGTGNNNIGTLNNFTLTGSTSNFTDNVVYPATAVSITSNTTNPYNNYNIIFTATAVAVGSDCTYQWYKNGSPITNATNAVYASATLVNNDQIYCIIRSSTACSAAADYQSNTITLHNAAAVKWYVKAGATGGGTSWIDAGDLQTVINNANGNGNELAGDSIFVAAGTYTSAASYSMKEGVKIFGGFPAVGNPTWANRDYINNVTVLKGSNGNRVMHNNNNGLTNAALLDGFTIRDGDISYIGYSADWLDSGAGMRNDNVSPTVRNCIFTNNKAAGNGAGVFNTGGTPLFVNCTFSANICSYQINSNDVGGGGMANRNSMPTLINCTFSDNRNYSSFSSGNSGGGGGALYNYHSDAVVTNCTFADNTAGSMGGAVYNRAASPVFTNCRFLNNYGYEGGALRNIEGGALDPGYSNPVYASCVFANNRAATGGAVYSSATLSSRGIAVFSNCIFYGNTTPDASGGWGRGGALYSSHATHKLINCVITYNTAAADAAVIFGLAATTDIRNTVITGNNGGVVCMNDGGGNTLNIYNSLVQSYTPGNSSNTNNALVYLSAENNIENTTNPQFVNLANPAGADGIWGTADDGLQLQACSPLVGAGNNSYITGTTDIRGNQRIYGNTVDIGAYESTYNQKIIVSTMQTNSCYGSANGSATVTVSGGTQPYTYTWSNGSDSTKAVNLAAGNYSCIITDANGCSLTKHFTITEPASAMVVDATQTNVSCYGNANGTATVTASGGTQPYTYTWSNGASVDKITGLTSGNYTCVITDAGGCSITKSFTITEPASALVVDAAQTNVSCYGNTNGTATVTVSGGTQPYTYTWSNGSDSTKAVNLTAGNYICTIIDKNGCAAVKTFTITQPDELAAVTSQQNVTCNGGNNGSAAITAVNGGTAPYTYNWSNGATTAIISGLVAGTYTCTITDGVGCSLVKTFTITQSDALTTYIASQTVVGSKTVTIGVTGGTPPYTYNWDNGATTATISGLTAGTYTCTITDANHCASVQQSVTVTELPANATTLYVDSSSVNFGSGGSWADAVKTLSDALIIARQNSNITTILVAKGTYYPTGSQSGTDRNISFLIPQRGGIKIYGGFAPGGVGGWAARTFPSSGGIGGSVLSADIGNANSNTDNSYHVMVIAGTSAMADSTVIDGFTITNANGSIGSSYLYNGISVMANTGGGMALYSNNNKTLIRNCSFKNNISNQGAGLFILVASPVIQNCFIQGNMATDNGGAMSSFSSSMPICINVLMTGNKASYGGAIFAHNSNNTLINCTVAGNYAIANGGGINNKGSANTTIKNSIVYGNVAAGNLPNIRNEEGGSANLAYSLIENSTGTWQSSFGTDNGSNTFLNPYFVNAVTTTNQNTPNTTGDYSLQSMSNAVGAGNNNFVPMNIVTDIVNVVRIQQNRVDIGAYESPYIRCGIVITVVSLNNVSCNGGNNGSVTISASGGSGTYQYSWTNGATGATATGLAAGDYTCTIIDTGSGCVTDITVTIAQPDELTASTTQQNINCYGNNSGSATVTPSGGTAPYTYSWSNGATNATISNLLPGNYTCTITDSKGCNIMKTFTITQPDVLTVHIVSQTPVVSGADATATLSVTGGTPPYAYSWDNGATTATATGLSARVYTCTVTDANHCAAVNQSVTITGLPANTTTLYVDSSAINSGNGSDWASSLKTLSDALIIANQNNNISSILVAKGTYYPTGLQSGTNRNATFLIPQRGIKIYGGFPSGGGTFSQRELLTSGGSILSGDIGTNNDKNDNSYHIMVIANMDNTRDSVVVDGFTITQGNANGGDSDTYNTISMLQSEGGGIYLNSNSSSKISIRNCTFSNNNGANYAGGMYNWQSSPAVSNCSFSNNTSDNGGGIMNFNGAAPVINNCTFTGNTANNLGGGMMNLNGAAPVITNCLFVANHVDNNIGGGMYNTDANPVISHSRFENNSAGMGGGMANDNNASPVVTNCVFAGNIAFWGFGGTGGGGLLNMGSAPIITNTLFTGNVSPRYGGGMCNYFASPVITNCTFSGNKVDDNTGGGIYNGFASSPKITNCIMYGNNIDMITTGVGSNPTVAYSIMQSSYSGMGNSTVNPQFLNAPDYTTAPFIGGDYHLQISSPAINAGKPDITGLNLPNTDLAGNPRVQNGRIDMGVYEYVEGTLPVTLIRFTVKADGNHAKLQWQTNNEINNKQFIIYRRSEDGEFMKIGDVLASSILNFSSQIYDYTDKSPFNGINYYKLVQVDNDGRPAELGIRSLTFRFAAHNFQVYPNPTTDWVTVSFTSGYFSMLQIIDVTGKVLQQWSVNNKEDSKILSLGRYQAGTYIIRLSGKGINETQKVVKK